MSRPTVLLTDPIHTDGAALLDAAGVEVVTAPDAQPGTLRTLVRDADGLIVRSRLPDDIVDHGRRLRGIVRHGVGLDFIPVAAAQARDISVANLPGSNSQAVAEYFFSALLHLRRPLGVIDRTHREGGWAVARNDANRTAEIGGTTLGIVGVGAIGSRIAEIGAYGFGMTVLGVSRSRSRLAGIIRYVDLPELFERADAIAICTALTDETRGLIGADLIGRMKPSAVIVNISRGPVVDTQPLAEALIAGEIGGAALDVFDLQPLPPDSPLFGCPRLLLTPHAASLTSTSLRSMSVGAAEEMLRILRGEPPLNLVKGVVR
jgi:D-3-phosphoglycerate dehydrogenase